MQNMNKWFKRLGFGGLYEVIPYFDGAPAWAASDNNIVISQLFDGMLDTFDEISCEVSLIQNTVTALLKFLNLTVSSELSNGTILEDKILKIFHHLLKIERATPLKIVPPENVAIYNKDTQDMEIFAKKTYILGGHHSALFDLIQADKYQVPYDYECSSNINGSLGMKPIEFHAQSLDMSCYDITNGIFLMQRDFDSIDRLLDLAIAFSKLSPKYAMRQAWDLSLGPGKTGSHFNIQTSLNDAVKVVTGILNRKVRNFDLTSHLEAIKYGVVGIKIRVDPVRIIGWNFRTLVDSLDAGIDTRVHTYVGEPISHTCTDSCDDSATNGNERKKLREDPDFT